MVRGQAWWLLLQGLMLLGLSACAAATAEVTQAPAELGQVTPPTAGQPTDPSPEPAAAGVMVFAIQPSESEARFVIGEILAGQPNTVIGVNRQVQGQFSLDLSDPGASQIGALQIGAGGFVTDSNLRNRAINQFILESGAHPVITFTPTSIGGLPEAVVVGQPAELEITGELTIRDITQPVTFTALVTLVAEGRLEGSASATIQRADFELAIPQVPRVAGVDEQVILEFDFVALAQ
jgi:polyisoprenoid-binding protein YceI